MTTYYLVAINALLIGGAWRYCFGHAWVKPGEQPDNLLQAHARIILETIGAALAALIIWANGGDIADMAAAALCTVAYFAIGNGTVLRGPTDPAWPYARALILKYLCPAILANIGLWFLDYHTAIAAAGAIAALGYFAFWKPDLHGLDAWNEKAEALSGAAWFCALAMHF
jgi:hypothetical protein